jgi:hypothetical protein
MRLKRTLVSAIAALGLAASVMTPVALAQSAPPTENGSNGNTSPSTISIEDNGVFDVYFYSTDLAFGTQYLNADDPEKTVNGSFIIGYDDSRAWRPGFTVTVQANDDSRGQTNSASNVIPVSGFEITRTEKIGQTQWGGPGSTAGSGGQAFDVGDIGYLVDESTSGVDQQAAGKDWSDGFSLDQARKVQFGYEGVGTIASGGNVLVELEIPVGTAPDNYRTTLVLTVAPPAP